jgi:hypothetical protein
MSENDPPDAESLRIRAEALERQLQEAMATHQAAMVRAELKAEAVRAGMVDLDGLKLVDLADVRVNEAGEIEGAAALMQKLRRAKPWLFGERHSSSPAMVPPAQPPQARRATEMSLDEWRAARAELLKRRS